MDNNDILRRIRYIFDLNDTQMVAIFAQADKEVSHNEVIGWLKKEDKAAFKAIDDLHMATFLNGLINEKRGKREGPQPVPESELNNNIIFRKLKIALNYKDVDILDVLEIGGRVISKHELSAFFRNPIQAQYRPCNDQILRNFLQGLQIKLRGDGTDSAEEKTQKPR